MAKQQKVNYADQKTSELACTYAALILYDDGIDVESSKMQALFKQANLRVEPFWTKVYEKALKGKNIGELLLGGGASAPAPAAQATAATNAPAQEAAKAPAKVEKAPEPEEDVDMGGLFDF